MNFRPFFPMAVALGMTLSIALPLLGTIYRQPRFEEMFQDADFVGIVECHKSGSTYAGFTVIESWRGAAVGREITLRIATDPYGPQMVAIPCGERYFVVGRKNFSTAWDSGGYIPHWSRQIPCDYRTSMFGFSKAPAAHEPFQISERTFQNRADFEKNLKAVLAKTPTSKNTSPSKRYVTESSEPSVPSKEDLDKLERTLHGADKYLLPSSAIPILARYRPGVVSRWLVALPPNASRMPEQTYYWGSHFALACGESREENLTRLLDAADPYIRVAGAVYLCFENESKGMEALRKFSELPGNPGAWAALTRARRGDKSAVPRAMALYDQGGSLSYDFPGSNFLEDLKALLSNAACRAKLRLPEFKNSYSNPVQNDKSRHQFYLDWWKTHEAKLQVSDPWLPILANQKVD